MGISELLSNQNFVFLIVPFIVLTLFALPYWFGFKKARLPSLTSVLLLIPFVNIIFIIYVLDSSYRQQTAAVATK